MTRDDTKPESIAFLDPSAWSMPVGTTMVIKQPEYSCPTHGIITSTIEFKRASTIEFNRVIEGTVRRFCMECCLDKIVEIGVSEVKEKKP
jgi:hypothetical protein